MHRSVQTETPTTSDVFSEPTLLDHTLDRRNGHEPTTPFSEDEEDYDRLKIDPNTVIKGGVGAGINRDGLLTNLVRPLAENGTPSKVQLPTDVEDSGRSGMTAGASPRRRSIQVVLEPTSRHGEYVLTADDPAIREILANRIRLEHSGQVPLGNDRPQLRDLVFTRRFTRFDRQNPASDSPFRGFFTLFWLGIGLLLIRVAMQNWKQYGNVLGPAEILHMMFQRDLIVLGLTDGVMTAATAMGLVLQKLIVRGYLTWNGAGWIIQNIWQICYLFGTIWWTGYREWAWTHTIFIVLHGLVFLMKQHSYAFYNGYLSQVYRRRAIVARKLAQLEETAPSPTAPGRASRSTSPVSVETIASALELGPSVSLRRHSAVNPKASTNLRRESTPVSNIAAAIESGEPLTAAQLRTFGTVLQSELAELDRELRGKCTHSRNHYPSNLTLANWADWICLPTLVYELEYPRQESINWWYVFEKTLATFGVIWVMIIVSQQFIYPPVMTAVALRDSGVPLRLRWAELPWVLSDMLFPLLLEQLLIWYVIWECCLNVLAEVTRFADRGFYGDWWNSVSWDQYARDWNRPVHNFLLRHVYHSSISALRLSKKKATFVTFLLSALVHELVMFCLFKKVRGYLFILQLSQLPLVELSRTKLLKGRNVLGNLVFWFGLFVGPSLLTSLYLIV